MTEDIRKIILDTLDDQISRFLYYDRKEDSILPVGAIENAFTNGDITVDDLIKVFSDRIYVNLGQRSEKA